MDLRDWEYRWATDASKIETVDYRSVPDQPKSHRGLHLVAVVRVAPYFLETHKDAVLGNSEIVVTANEDVPRRRGARSLAEPIHQVVFVLVHESRALKCHIHREARARIEVLEFVQVRELRWSVRSGRGRHQSDQNRHGCQESQRSSHSGSAFLPLSGASMYTANRTNEWLQDGCKPVAPAHIGTYGRH